MGSEALAVTHGINPHVIMATMSKSTMPIQHQPSQRPSQSRQSSRAFQARARIRYPQTPRIDAGTSIRISSKRMRYQEVVPNRRRFRLTRIGVENAASMSRNKDSGVGTQWNSPREN